jgi:hypothetical protein
MKTSSVKPLQYFVGKICTIFISGHLQRNFNDSQFNDYFVGQIDLINEDFVMTTHPATNCKNCYNLADVVAISEEQQLNPENPEDAAIIEEIRQRQLTPIVREDLPVDPYETSEYFDADQMDFLARQAADLKGKKNVRN